MERIDKDQERRNKKTDRWGMDKGKKGGFFGVFLILLGIWWLIRKIDPVGMPDWVTTWPVLLFAAGFLNLVYHNFKSGFGVVLMVVGGFFLARDYWGLLPEIGSYFWPAVVILIGLSIVFKHNVKHRRKKKRSTQEWSNEDACMTKSSDNADELDELAVMGGFSKDILSKNFKGGDITCVMAGGELYFSNADLADECEIDMTMVMAGMKIVVPRHWNVEVNTTNIMAGVDDKRHKEIIHDQPEKTLKIKGLIFMGGIDIQSY